MCHDPGNPLPPTAVTSTAPPERSAPPTAPDVRTLSLAQLHRLAEGGSRRARAELERRMREPGPAAAGPAPHAPSVAAATPGSARPASAPRAAAAPDGGDARIDSWVLIERQQLERARQDGPPRLVGLVLLAWGALLGLGGLALLARGGGAYYLLCGLACAGVGALLMRCSRWAMALQALAVLLALAWAWRGAGMVLAVLQAAPVWLAALWAAVPAVREPLR